MAIAMTPLARLAMLLDLPELKAFEQTDALRRANEIKPLIATRIGERSTTEWLAVLEPEDIWCAEVLDWPALSAKGGFEALDMLQKVRNASGAESVMVRCPLRLDGLRIGSEVGAPLLGAHTEEIRAELGIG